MDSKNRTADAGRDLYATNCMRCHGADVVNSGATPDLRRSTTATHELFADIVLGGLREPLGMPAFDDLLNAEDVRRIQAYVLARARESAGGN